MIENKFTREVVKDLVQKSFDIACDHGFHDEVHSDEHYMMLVISEIGEMVEADRKSRHANLKAFYDAVTKPQPEGQEDKHFDFCFKTFIKDTFEDELSDVVIRLFDYLGTIEAMPTMLESGFVDMGEDFEHLFGQYSTCEHCYALTNLVMSITRGMGKKEKAENVGMVLSMAYELSKRMGFDLLTHVRLKMQYNEHRAPKHGKKY
jgi:NTP pyrophosphatase (non-canonical NTP hydrolase)